MAWTKKYSKARKFLKKILNRNFWAFLFFLSLSAGFWLFLTLEDEYDMEISVPVEMVGVPKEVTITDSLPSEIKIKVHDHGGVLLKYRYAGTLGKITINFNDYYSKSSGHVTILTAKVIEGVRNKLQGSTKILGFDPDTLEYYYNYGRYKDVPLILTGTVSADSLYSVEQIRLSKETVRVYASQSILDTLRAVYTQPLVASKLSKTEDFGLKIQPIKGCKIVPSSVTAKVYVDQRTEKTLQVPVRWINFPASKELKTFPGVVSVIFQVGTEKYNTISADSFVIMVNYDDVADNPSGKLKLKLRSQPEGVTHARISPDEVDFIVEDKGDDAP